MVIGGGITGLAAAWEATGGATPRPLSGDVFGELSGVRVTVLESSDRFGGKVRTSALDLPGGPLIVDEGADNFLARVPDAVDLCVELGLADQLTQPAIGRAAVWIDGQVRPYMARHVLGVPLSATNRHPGFTSRLSWVTKSMAVSGNSPGMPNARATSTIVHNGVALMQPSLRARPLPPAPKRAFPVS